MKGAVSIDLTERQAEIVRIIQGYAPITGEQIAERLKVSRPTLRSDLALLVMLGIVAAKPKVGYFPVRPSHQEMDAFGDLRELRVKDVQGAPVAIRETSTINDAVVTLFLENVGSLIVIDQEGRLNGVVSRKDLLKVTLGNALAATLPVSLIMTREPNIVAVAPDDPLFDAIGKMIHYQVDSLPVIIPSPTGSGREPVGRVSKTSIVKLLWEKANLKMRFGREQEE